MVHTVATFNSIKVRHQSSFPGLPWSPSPCPTPVFSKALVLMSCVSCSNCHSPGSKGVLVIVTFCAAGAVIGSPSPASASRRAGNCGEHVIRKAVKAFPDSFLGPRPVCLLRTGSCSHAVLGPLPSPHHWWCHQDQSRAADVGLCPLGRSSKADAVRQAPG